LFPKKEKKEETGCTIATKASVAKRTQCVPKHFKMRGFDILVSKRCSRKGKESSPSLEGVLAFRMYSLQAKKVGV
jgi:hypothetical protein